MRECQRRKLSLLLSRATRCNSYSEMPLGLNHVVGERGVKLSGASASESQSRALFLKNAPILILDEATSALDSESERMSKRTGNFDARAHLVGHRTSLSTIEKSGSHRRAAKGEIVEIGTPPVNCWQNNGVYAQLHRIQFANIGYTPDPMLSGIIHGWLLMLFNSHVYLSLTCRLFWSFSFSLVDSTTLGRLAGWRWHRYFFMAIGTIAYVVCC